MRKRAQRGFGSRGQEQVLNLHLPRPTPHYLSQLEHLQRRPNNLTLEKVLAARCKRLACATRLKSARSEIANLQRQKQMLH
jgi:hypothetical protein